jgi:ribosomal-protein-alanine N-acetyltransferase
MIDAYKRSYENRSALSFALVADDRIVGITNFSSISGSPFHACFIGFSIDSDLEGKGYARHMLLEAISRTFVEHKLNRIMANYIPRNVRSARLLHSIGFEMEGFAREYLEINGVWEDHFLTSLLEKKWRSLNQ